MNQIKKTIKIITTGLLAWIVILGVSGIALTASADQKLTVEQTVVKELKDNNILTGQTLLDAENFYAQRIDLKVGGQSDTVTVNYMATTTISWTSKNNVNCLYSLDNGAHYVLASEESAWFGTSSTRITPKLATTTYVTVKCVNKVQEPIYKNATIVVNRPVLANIDLFTTDKANPSAKNISTEFGYDENIFWKTSNAEDCTLSQNNIIVKKITDDKTLAEGSFTAQNLIATTTYVLECNNLDHVKASSTIKIAVNNALPVIEFTAATSSVASRDSITVKYKSNVTLNWKATNNAVECYLDKTKVRVEGSNSTLFTNLTKSASTTLTCYNNSKKLEVGSSKKTIEVIVLDQEVPSITLKSAVPSVDYNKATTLSWSTVNAKSCTLKTGDSKPVSKAVSEDSLSTGNLIVTTTYELSCENDNGDPYATTTVVGVIQPAEVAIDFSAANTSILEAASTTLSWTAANAEKCSLYDLTSKKYLIATSTGAVSSIRPYLTGTLYEDNAYRLSCVNKANVGTSTDVTVSVSNVDNITKFDVQATPIAYGSSTKLSWSTDKATKSCQLIKIVAGKDNVVSNVPLNSTGISTGVLTVNTTYKLVCNDKGGNPSELSKNVRVLASNASVMNITANDEVGSTASPLNGSATISWSADKVKSCTVTGTVGNKTVSVWTGISGKMPTNKLVQDTVYALNCINKDTNQSDMVSVVVDVVDDTLPNVREFSMTNNGDTTKINASDVITLNVDRGSKVRFDWDVRGSVGTCKFNNSKVNQVSNYLKTVNANFEAKLECTNTYNTGSIIKTIKVNINPKTVLNETDINVASVYFTVDQVVGIIKALFR